MKMGQVAWEVHELDNVLFKETVKKRCRILHIGGPGDVPQLMKIPHDWGIRGLIEILSSVSNS